MKKMSDTLWKNDSSDNLMAFSDCHDLVILLFHAQKLFCTNEWLHGFAESCPVVR